MRRWRRKNELSGLEAHLRDSRPEAPDGLVQSVSDRVRPRRGLRPQGARLGLALGLTTVALGLATAYGGMSFAASSVGDAVDVVKRIGKPSTPKAVARSAATDQYENECGAGAPNGPCVVETRPRSMFVNETDGCVGMTIAITQGRVSNGTASVSYRTRQSTARPPQDYTHEQGTVSFPAGTNVQPIDICINDDAVTEPRESFIVELFNPVNATIAGTGGTGQDQGRTTININSNTN